MNARLQSALSSRSFLLTNWITASSSSADVIQDSDGWLDVAGFNDATFYVEVSQFSNPTGGYVLLYLESAPFPDEATFTAQPLAGPIVCAASSAPYVAKTASGGRMPLSKYVRWRAHGTTANPWSATFRIRVVVNRSRYFAPTDLGGCALWLRADRGLTFSGTTVTGWSDQSGLNDRGRNLVAGSSPPTQTLADGQYGNQPTISFSGNINCYFSNPSSWLPSITHPKTWVLVGHRSATTGTNYFMDGNSMTAGDAVSDSNTGVITCHSGNPLTSGAGNSWGGASAMLFESAGASSACYLNNFTTALMTGNAGSNTIDSISLGCHSLQFGGGSAWQGPMAEVIAFNGTLSSWQKTLLRRYLNNRYALSIT